MCISSRDDKRGRRHAQIKSFTLVIHRQSLRALKENTEKNATRNYDLLSNIIIKVYEWYSIINYYNNSSAGVTILLNVGVLELMKMLYVYSLIQKWNPMEKKYAHLVCTLIHKFFILLLQMVNFLKFFTRWRIIYMDVLPSPSSMFSSH